MGCQWNQPLFSKQLQKNDFFGKQLKAEKRSETEEYYQREFRLSNSQALSRATAKIENEGRNS